MFIDDNRSTILDNYVVFFFRELLRVKILVSSEKWKSTKEDEVMGILKYLIVYNPTASNGFFSTTFVRPFVK